LNTAAARAVTYSVIGLLAFAAVHFNRPLPPRSIAKLAKVEASPPLWRERVDTMARGETLFGVLARGGVSEMIAREALRTVEVLDPRRVPAGMTIATRTAGADSIPSEIVFQLAVDRLVRLRRAGDGSWSGVEERLPWTTDTVVVSGVIASTLYEAVDSAASDVLGERASAELTYTVADIFEYRVDMSRDLQAGDAFRVLAERETAPGGLVRLGKVLAVDFTLSGSQVRAVRFASRKVSGDYFDQDGKSMRAAFLRAPLAFRRISSVFGKRKHPILGVWKQHKGVDYAANSGTPVRAIGDGTVIHAGWRGGYGNTLEIRHRNGYVTRYGHLRGFAKGVRRGSRVTIAQTVAYVGSTGLSTAPHLHFEVLVGGTQRDPRTALRQKGGDPIPSSERAAFLATQAQLFASLDRLQPETRLAQR
jgi:murein DD-endopeptidase MepM/ murein hydrolase activator NlpD